MMKIYERLPICREVVHVDQGACAGVIATINATFSVTWVSNGELYAPLFGCHCASCRPTHPPSTSGKEAKARPDGRAQARLACAQSSDIRPAAGRSAAGRG